jgi:hypothetical protein
MRKVFYFGAVVAMTVVTIAGNAGASDSKTTVVAEGEATFHANHEARITFQWSDDNVSVKRGSVLTVRDEVTPSDLFGGGHTFTIVKASDVPTSVSDAFGDTCFPDPSSPNQGCAAAANHFATDPPTPVVNAGAPGINQPGDSLLVPGAGSVSAPVTAPRGTTLHFICTFHPWMQGTLTVE